MRLFRSMYMRTLVWARHPHAERFLGGLSFIEAFAFPIPPELMLAPMCISEPKKGWRYATISLVFSLLGSLVGYALGYFAFAALQPLLLKLGWTDAIDLIVVQLRGDVVLHPWTMFWLLVLAGFTPVPLKLFTWASGIVGVPLGAFVAGMLVGRGKRVYLLAILLRWMGPRAEDFLHRWIEWIGWLLLALLAILALWWFGLH